MGVLKITRGIQQAPVRGCIYGDEGIGKTTLAVAFPNPIVLDTEDGSRHLDVARVAIHDWKSLTLALAELAVQPQGFQTVVIDSADWAEKALAEWLLESSDKKSIEDFGFGKGYTMLAEHWSRMLAACDKLVAAGMHVVFVAHAKVVRTSPPDQTDGYDRYELKLSKQVAPALKEWVDLLLFANYQTRLVEGSDGRMKAKGGKERILHAEHAAAWDAKNRFGLPASMPMEIGQLRPIFGKPVAKADAKESADAFERATKRIASATTVSELGRIGDRVDELASLGQLTAEQADELRARVGRRHDQIEPQEASTNGVA
jgi:hypothetical protein